MLWQACNVQAADLLAASQKRLTFSILLVLGKIVFS
jgi:hypothetical protein